MMYEKERKEKKTVYGYTLICTFCCFPDYFFLVLLCFCPNALSLAHTLTHLHTKLSIVCLSLILLE